MSTSLLLLAFLAICFQFQPHSAASIGPLVKHFNSLIKWTRSYSRTSHSVGNVLQFEDGYLVETVVKGSELGVVPYKIDVSPDGELYAVDSINSNIVRITPPLSQYSRARLIAGSFQGHTGHVDGKPNEACFNHPSGVTMDDKGNVYVADISNLAIRKIGEAGVTTIAGGKSNIEGYRDGPSEDAQFSNDFDVIYVRPTCSLLVVDRGNAALRQISLNQEDCDYHYSSLSTLGFGSFIDIFMIAGTIMVGYVACILQQGFGSNIFSEMRRYVETEEEQELIKEKSPVIETVTEEPEAGWPSFGQLVWDLFKLALEALGTIFTHLNPLQVRHKNSKSGLIPLKDFLVMPEDEVESPLVQNQRITAPLFETKQIHAQNANDKFSDATPARLRTSSLKDPLLSSKFPSSKRHEYSEHYGSAEAPQHVQARSKSQKEMTKYCRQEKSREANFDASGVERKHVEVKGVSYEDTRYKLYNIRDKNDDSYCYK